MKPIDVLDMPANNVQAPLNNSKSSIELENTGWS